MKILKKEAREIREEIKKIVNRLKGEGFFLKNSNYLEVEVEVYENWYNKNGTVKKKDVMNREKFLTDSIFKELDLDDKVIFKYTIIKKQSDKEYSIIKIKDYEEI